MGQQYGVQNVHGVSVPTVLLDMREFLAKATAVAGVCHDNGRTLQIGARPAKLFGNYFNLISIFRKIRCL